MCFGPFAVMVFSQDPSPFQLQMRSMSCFPLSNTVVYMFDQRERLRVCVCVCMCSPLFVFEVVFVLIFVNCLQIFSSSFTDWVQTLRKCDRPAADRRQICGPPRQSIMLDRIWSQWNCILCSGLNSVRTFPAQIWLQKTRFCVGLKSVIIRFQLTVDSLVNRPVIALQSKLKHGHWVRWQFI